MLCICAVHTVSTDLNSVFIQKIAMSHLMCDLDDIFFKWYVKFKTIGFPDVKFTCSWFMGVELCGIAGTLQFFPS